MSDTAPDFSGPIQASPEIVLNNETGLIDFSEGFIDNNGRMCQNKTIRVETIVKEPVVECVHKNINTCHYGYVTRFKNHRVEECHDNYEKKCSISYKQVRVS